MPRGDRTGPDGSGSMTGRALGFCAGFSAPGFLNNSAGRAFLGRGRSFSGGGRGRRNMYYATGTPGWARYNNDYSSTPVSNITPEEEIDMLNAQAQNMKENIDAINDRIKRLQKTDKQ